MVSISNSNNAFVYILYTIGEQSFVNYSSNDVSDYAEKEAGRTAIQEGFTVVVTTDAGSEIQTDILELYFENKRYSGGGPIKSCLKDGQQFIVTFKNEAGISIPAFI